MKRICLFAGFNYRKKILPYVVDYLSDISKHADVYYLTDSYLDIGELDKIKPYTKGAWFLNHGKYDFGSYSELAKNYVGWNIIQQYDELILANDSCFCVNSFDRVFQNMEQRECDVWGLLAHDDDNISHIYSLDEYVKIPIKRIPLFCIGSYFICVRKKVINNILFRKFLENIKKQKSRFEVCVSYEMGLTKFFIENNYKIDCFINIVYKNTTIYSIQAFNLLKYKFPLLKIRTFQDNPVSIKFLDLLTKEFQKYTIRDLEYYVRQVDLDRKIVINDLLYLCRRQSYLSFKAFIKNCLPPFLLFLIRKMIQKVSVYRLIFLGKIKHCYNRLKESYHNEQIELLKPFLRSKKLVIFFNISRDLIGGGMLSINRFVEYSKPFAKQYKFDLIMSAVPLHNAVINYSKFKASLPLIDFNYIVLHTAPQNVLLNIPECFLPIFINELNKDIYKWLRSINNLQINIMNQNNDLMPSTDLIEELRDITHNITITTAHSRYCNQELAEKYNCPVSLLTPFLPKFYETDVSKKENIILLSPDNEIPICENITKSDIVNKLQHELPHYKLVHIENMSLEEYKIIISRAKFTITFGEGFDGYFIEPYLSNSIAFAVYNNTFFPKDFEDCKTVYKSFQNLYDNIVLDIRNYDNDHTKYRSVQVKVKKLISSKINTKISLKNLRDFYNSKYHFIPNIYKKAHFFDFINS